MRPVVITISIVLSTITVFVLSTKRFSTFAYPSDELGIFLVQPSTSILRFEEVGHACGGPNQSWVTGYIAYDGKRLSLSNWTYHSASEASHKLQTLLQAAARIQETGAKYSPEGQIVGERAVAFFNGEKKEVATILWTEEKSLFMIEAEALDCALEFERIKVE